MQGRHEGVKDMAAREKAPVKRSTPHFAITLAVLIVVMIVALVLYVTSHKHPDYNSVFRLQPPSINRPIPHTRARFQINHHVGGFLYCSLSGVQPQ